MSYQGECEAQEVAARLEEMMAGLIKVPAPLQFRLFEYIKISTTVSPPMGMVVDASMEFERWA